MSSARKFFTQEQQEDIRQAIIDAELDTSGEIRVHIENDCKGEVLDRALFFFHKLGMEKTAGRNGVLIYLAVKDKKFAIIGDEGIHKAVPDNFWDQIKDNMLKHFKVGQFAEGLTEAITEAGKQLKAFFPYQSDDVNELPDDISFS